VRALLDGHLGKHARPVEGRVYRAEYCEILAGTSVITDEEGNAKTLRTGHRFVIPPGFRGTWEVVEHTRKIFVAYDEQPPE
jgi:uncharacterized protein